jgi:tetratricopeptide (TPR) repeat protein
MHTEARSNAAYELRLKESRRILGKDTWEIKKDEETGEEIIVQKKHVGKTITKEQAQALEYRAIVAEGNTLYHAKEYRRAIEAFTQAMEKQKEDQNVLIYRAKCYIQVGEPDEALRDVDLVLRDHPTNPKAILTKAEAYFSMGEFEFALVFFQRGNSIRKDMVAFRDGITKCKSAILDSINGVQLFQANPNFADSRPREALPGVKVPEEKTQPRDEDPQKLKRTAELLPEKVEPLPIKLGCKEFLGELSLDYEYLLELQAEINGQTEDTYGKDEDEKILGVVDDALMYLDQRSAFWSQQDGSRNDEAAQTQTAEAEEGEAAEQRQQQPGGREAGKASPKGKSPTRGRKVSPPRGTKASPSPQRKQGAKAARYEMSKIQQYEAKYGKTDQPGKPQEQPPANPPAADAEPQ